MTLNIAVFAPMLSDRARRAIAVKPGDWRRRRTASRTSPTSAVMGGGSGNDRARAGSGAGPRTPGGNRAAAVRPWDAGVRSRSMPRGSPRGRLRPRRRSPAAPG